MSIEERKSARTKTAARQILMAPDGASDLAESEEMLLVLGGELNKLHTTMIKWEELSGI